MKDDYYTYLQVPYLGQSRADHEYPMKSFFDNGVLVASASDFPVTYPPDPLDGIQTGVMRWFQDWVLDRQPSGPRSAYHAADDPQLHDQRRPGQLPRSDDRLDGGRQERRPHRARPQHPHLRAETIGQSKVLMTMFRGREVFRDAQF